MLKNQCRLLQNFQTDAGLLVKSSEYECKETFTASKIRNDTFDFHVKKDAMSHKDAIDNQDSTNNSTNSTSAELAKRFRDLAEMSLIQDDIKSESAARPNNNKFLLEFKPWKSKQVIMK